MLLERREKRQERQTQYGEIIALDAFEQANGRAFEPVSGDRIEDRLAFEIEHPVEGKQTFSRRAVYIDGSRDDQPMNPPPQLSEHTDEVLAELGLNADAVRDLRARGVV